MAFINEHLQDPQLGSVYQCRESQSGMGFEVLAQGARLRQLCLGPSKQGMELIALPGHSDHLIHQNPYHPSAIMAPWVNRIRHGNYAFGGKTYELPINEIALNNAIHGLLASQTFECLSFEAEQEQSKLVLQYAYHGSEAGYPFPFELNLSFSLDLQGQFNLALEFKNTGQEPLPYCLGWHPYFQLGHWPLKECSLSFAPVARYISDEQMIPFKKEAIAWDFPIKLAEIQPDHVFLLDTKLQEHLVELQHPACPQALYLKHEIQDFPYFVVFMPEGEPGIALEPMSGNTDAFNSEDGLKVLEPLAQFQAKIVLNIGNKSPRPGM